MPPIWLHELATPVIPPEHRLRSAIVRFDDNDDDDDDDDYDDDLSTY